MWVQVQRHSIGVCVWVQVQRHSIGVCVCVCVCGYKYRGIVQTFVFVGLLCVKLFNLHIPCCKEKTIKVHYDKLFAKIYAINSDTWAIGIIMFSLA